MRLRVAAGGGREPCSPLRAAPTAVSSAAPTLPLPPLSPLFRRRRLPVLSASLVCPLPFFQDKNASARGEARAIFRDHKTTTALRPTHPPTSLSGRDVDSPSSRGEWRQRERPPSRRGGGLLRACVCECGTRAAAGRPSAPPCRDSTTTPPTFPFPPKQRKNSPHSSFPLRPSHASLLRRRSS